MARKHRGNALFSQLSTQTNNSYDLSTIENVEVDALKSMPGQESKLTNENKEKLEMFDNLQISNSELYAKNEQLTEKIAEYLTELSTLREQNEQVTELSKQIETLSADIDKKNNEIDQYLIRISELTFDNARLRASMQNIQNQPQSTPVKSNPVKCQSVYLQRNRSLNGYESWN